MSPAKPTPDDPLNGEAPNSDPLSYEAARDELVAVVKQLESGSATLEESLALWERGEELAAICQRWLDGARARLAARAPDAATGATEVEDIDDEG